jgi:hypothetical protein
MDSTPFESAADRSCRPASRVSGAAARNYSNQLKTIDISELLTV